MQVINDEQGHTQSADFMISVLNFWQNLRNYVDFFYFLFLFFFI